MTLLRRATPGDGARFPTACSPPHTVPVLDRRPPEQWTFGELPTPGPRGFSRGKLPFIANVNQSTLSMRWPNKRPSPVVVQFRASVFYMPAGLSTAWMAVKNWRRSWFFYSAVFFLVNATYVLLIL
jgi:hypothetical protein